MKFVFIHFFLLISLCDLSIQAYYSVSDSIVRFYEESGGGSYDTLFLPIKDEIVPDSLKIDITVIGNVLGAPWENIQNLINIPSGEPATCVEHSVSFFEGIGYFFRGINVKSYTECSSKTFSTLMLNTAALNYFSSTEQLTDQFISSAKNYIALGYKNLCEERKSDGSFSFRRASEVASMWSTAEIAKVLNHAKRFTVVNERDILTSLNYISNRQQSDGSFSGETKMTAFCAIVFLENRDYRRDFKTTIDKALNYTVSKSSTTLNNFELAISAYALSLNQHQEANNFLKKLIENAIKEDDDLMYWYLKPKALKSDDPPEVNVKIAAYALLALVEMERTEEAFPIFKWLKTQWQSSKGFYSESSTYIGIQALARISEKLFSPITNGNIEIVDDKNRKTVFKINENNAMQRQVKILQNNTREINFLAKGKGVFYTKTSYRYNVILDDPKKSFDLTAVPTLNGITLNLKICAKLIPDAEYQQANITRVDVNLPKGYFYDPKTAEMVRTAGVRRVETENQKQLIILYFDIITTKETCFNVQAYSYSYTDNERKNYEVKIYDYNQKDHQASAFYSL